MKQKHNKSIYNQMMGDNNNNNAPKSKLEKIASKYKLDPLELEDLAATYDLNLPAIGIMAKSISKLVNKKGITYEKAYENFAEMYHNQSLKLSKSFGGAGKCAMNFADMKDGKIIMKGFNELATFTIKNKLGLKDSIYINVIAANKNIPINESRWDSISERRESVLKDIKYSGTTAKDYFKQEVENFNNPKEVTPLPDIPDNSDFKTLGVDEFTRYTEAKGEYKNLAREHHPDKNPENKEEATEKFRSVQEAWEKVGPYLKAKESRLDEHQKKDDSHKTEQTGPRPGYGGNVD